MLDLYDLRNLSFSFAGQPLHADNGWGVGGALRISRQTPRYGYTVGVGGRVTRHRNGDEMHQIELTLSQESGANQLLSAIVLADAVVTNGAGVGPIAIECGAFVFACPNGWIESEPAEVVFTNEAQDRVWILWAPDPKRVGG